MIESASLSVSRSGQFLHLQVPELDPARKVVRLQRDVARRRPGTRVGVDLRPVQRNGDLLAVGFYEIRIPHAQRLYGEARWTLQCVDGAGAVDRCAVGCAAIV